jgi:Domain of Unknown Function (DUF928)
MYWSELISDQFFFNHSLFYSFAGAGDSTAVTLQASTLYSLMNDRICIKTRFRAIQRLLAAVPLHFAIGLGTLISLGISIPIVIAQPNIPTAQQLKQKKKVPPPPAPPSRGVPGNRTVSASMSGNSCDLKLIALAPQFNANTSGQISEKSVWGKTTSPHPTFWFFVPETPRSTQLEFFLQNQQEEDIYRTSVPTPQQSGTIGVRIPTSQAPLQLNQNYHWTLKAKVPCGTSTPNRVYVDGWVTRVNLPGVSQQNNSDSYAQKGIWYDAVTSLAQQRLQKPNDLQVEQDWSDLLESGNLQSIAKQPLLRSGY